MDLLNERRETFVTAHSSSPIQSLHANSIQNLDINQQADVSLLSNFCSKTFPMSDSSSFLDHQEIVRQSSVSFAS